MKPSINQPIIHVGDLKVYQVNETTVEIDPTKINRSLPTNITGVSPGRVLVVSGGTITAAITKKLLTALASMEMEVEAVKIDDNKPLVKYKPSKGKRDKFSRLQAIYQGRR